MTYLANDANENMRAHTDMSKNIIAPLAASYN